MNIHLGKHRQCAREKDVPLHNGVSMDIADDAAPDVNDADDVAQGEIIPDASGSVANAKSSAAVIDTHRQSSAIIDNHQQHPPTAIISSHQQQTLKKKRGGG